eukprot:TRINITY_DN1567_c0_g1_i1.p2 TRINITY_DN1567_c0_g1~~TRINITY_DN1567_c0_g1_i1.p2  ORF type:complete len:50 (-),score=15.34 TRINITY_DN1567_c0_g1_i1:347-496(-)
MGNIPSEDYQGSQIPSHKNFKGTKKLYSPHIKMKLLKQSSKVGKKPSAS